MLRTYPSLIFVILWAILCSSCAPNIPNLKGRIAFVSDQDGNSDIFLIDVNGQNLRQLTNDSAEDLSPAWSPDGKRIAFTSNRDGDWEIYTMDANGDNIFRLTRGPEKPIGDLLAWSPDGKQIAFSYRDQLMMLDIVNGNISKTTFDDMFIITPSWSPDGLKMIFVGSYRSKSDIYIINRDASDNIRMTDSDWFTEALVTPKWSPDGSNIAFGKIIYDQEVSYRTFVMSPDGSNLKQITDECAGESWSPDSQWIVCSSRYQANSNKTSEIYIVNILDGRMFRVTNNSFYDSQPSWSP